MNIEPLKNILELSNNKQNSILYFLNDNIKNKLNKFYLYEENKDIFINQSIICIKKNNLLLDIKGKIISIKYNKIGIIINNKYTKYINKNDYYIFIKDSHSLNNDRKFFENLLKNLE